MLARRGACPGPRPVAVPGLLRPARRGRGGLRRRPAGSRGRGAAGGGGGGAGGWGGPAAAAARPPGDGGAAPVAPRRGGGGDPLGGDRLEPGRRPGAAPARPAGAPLVRVL